MGRQQYVTRLALGRSAFEDVDAQTGSPPRTESTASAAYVQQYDSRGRPTNPTTDNLNAELRKAQNDVLAVVGVVERKDVSNKIKETKQRIVNERRRILLLEEQDQGEMLGFVLLLTLKLLQTWSESFVQRIQIGYYHEARSMADILFDEGSSMLKGGVRASLARLFPGTGRLLVSGLVRVPLVAIAEQIVGRIHHRAALSTVNRRAAYKLHRTMKFVFEILLLTIDAALLPMKLHTTAQFLGIAPALPLFPPVVAFLPWHGSSYHHFAWSPLLVYPFLGRLTSAGVFTLLEKVMEYDVGEAEHGTDSPPVFSLFTNYRFDPINPSRLHHMRNRPSGSFWSDPFGCILCCAYTWRSGVLEWCGWRIANDAPSRHLDESSALEGNVLLDEAGDRPETQPPGSADTNEDTRERPTYRATELAHLPARTLARAVDDIFGRLLTLPFDSLMLRVIAASYLASTATMKTASAVADASHFYAPFGGGPFGQLLGSPGSTSLWTSAGRYLSRLGLAFALHGIVNTALFFGTWTITRHIGIAHFDWGRGRMSSVHTPWPRGSRGISIEDAET